MCRLGAHPVTARARSGKARRARARTTIRSDRSGRFIAISRRTRLYSLPQGKQTCGGVEGGYCRVGTAGFEQADDFGSAVAGALDDFFQLFLLYELSDGDSTGERIARQRHHVIAVAAEEEGMDVFDAAADFGSEEAAVSGGIEHTGL